jgi:hypothetical protein
MNNTDNVTNAQAILGIDSATIKIAVILLFLIVGIVLWAIASSRKKRVVKILAVGCLGGACVTAFVEFANLREILTAFASVAALFISAMSIDQTRKIRQDTLDKENRDRKEKILDDIQEWIIEILDIVSSCNPPGNDETKWKRNWRVNRVLLLKNSIILKVNNLGIEVGTNRLEICIIELSKIVDEQKKDPIALLCGVKSGEKIFDQINKYTDESLRIILDVRKLFINK